MTKTKKPKMSLPAILLLCLFVFLITPFGSNLVRNSYLSIKNGNIVGQASPGQLDGIAISSAASPRAASEAVQASWVLWSFFSPT